MMTDKTDLKKHWVLSQTSFDKLLSSLDPDRESAGEKYEVLRLKLLKYFEWRGCPSPDVYVDETINRLARRISEGETITDVSSYSYGIARLVMLEVLKQGEKERAALSRAEAVAPDAAWPVPECETDPRLTCFRSCISNLPEDKRRLITDYYYRQKREKIDRRKELADRMGIPLNALRIRVHRTKAKLEQCVSECLGQHVAA
jgi:DNA-directed RNA polymerase specialized sigma24 family protein